MTDHVHHPKIIGFDTDANRAADGHLLNCPRVICECPPDPNRADSDPCVPVQDDSQEAATTQGNEQAGTQHLPLCTHGYYATRCPTCNSEET